MESKIPWYYCHAEDEMVVSLASFSKYVYSTVTRTDGQWL